MTGWTTKTWALAASLMMGLSSSIGSADPLHPAGNDGSWRHEYSGWLFTRQVGDFARVMAPYTIDGNNDAGVRYENASGVSAVVEIYLLESSAADAKLEGAKASAAQKAGESARPPSEQPFQIKEHNELRGTRIAYADEKSHGPQTNLYFFESARWTVKVLGTGPSADAGKALDAFVQALPWNTLGDPAALH